MMLAIYFQIVKPKNKKCVCGEKERESVQTGQDVNIWGIKVGNHSTHLSPFL